MGPKIVFSSCEFAAHRFAENREEYTKPPAMQASRWEGGRGGEGGGGGTGVFLKIVDMHSSFRIFAVHLRKPFLIDLSRSLPRLLLFASKLQRQYHMVSGTSEYLWKDFVCVTLNPLFYKILIIPPPLFGRLEVNFL